jgi:hypothetical protein
MSPGNMELNGPLPIGAKKANLSAEAEQYMQEVALNEQVIMSSCCGVQPSCCSQSQRMPPILEVFEAGSS